MIPDVIAGFRQQWASRFTDSLTVSEDQRGSFSPSTGEYATVSDSSVYNGVALVRPAGGEPTLEMFAQTAITTSDHVVFVPHTATGIKPGHQVTIDTSDDPDLQGRAGRVIAVTHDTYVTRRAVLCRFDQEGP